MPLTTGLRHPAILLPDNAVAWPKERLASVLLHELAHVRRRDIAWTLVCEAALLIAWLHPFGHALRRRIALLREEACDDVVITTGIPGHAYAGHLASLLRGGTRVPSGLGLAAVQCSGWYRRFRRLLDPGISRQSAAMWQVVLISALALTALTVGTLFLGCTGAHTIGPAGQSIATGFPKRDPITLPSLHREAQLLRIKMKVVEARPKQGTTPQEQAKAMGFSDGFPVMGAILSPEQGQAVFGVGRRGVVLVTAPVVKARSGQQATVEIGEEVVVPVEFLKNDKTGKYEAAATENFMTGVTLAVTARPTVDAKRIHLDLNARMKEFDHWMNYGEVGFVQPAFYTRQIAFSNSLENGSYIIIGQRPDSQTMTQSVPLLSDIPFVGRLFQMMEDQTFIRLAAVQVIVEEATE